MFQVGDFVVHGNNGVCRVEAIGLWIQQEFLKIAADHPGEQALEIATL